MSAPALQSDTIPEVGRFYMVPCARVMVQAWPDGEWQPAWRHPCATAANQGWVPVIGEVHEDREVIGFQPDHVHVDVRFAWLFSIETEKAMARPLVARDSLWDSIRDRPARFEFMHRRLKCRRPGQLFPVGVWTPRLEQAYAGCRLGADGLCPHRGIPVAAGHQLPDGSMVCPGHGLRWGQDGQLLHRGEP